MVGIRRGIPYPYRQVRRRYEHGRTLLVRRQQFSMRQSVIYTRSSVYNPPFRLAHPFSSFVICQLTEKYPLEAQPNPAISVCSTRYGQEIIFCDRCGAVSVSGRSGCGECSAVSFRYGSEHQERFARSASDLFSDFQPAPPANRNSPSEGRPAFAYGNVPGRSVLGRICDRL